LAGNKINAVLFDLGETLLNFGKVNTTRLFRQGAKLSYDFLKSCGQPTGNYNYYCWRNLILLRWRYWLSNITERDFNAFELFKQYGDKKGITLTADQWKHFSWLWYEPLYELSQDEPQAKETLTKLKQMGLKLGIVSNTFVHASSLEKHLDHLGILDFFEIKLYSYEFAFRKPDPRIFEIAAERIGEKPENIMYVGDRLDKDVEGATKAGMSPVLKHAYTNKQKQIPKTTPQIERIHELPTLIEKINKESAPNSLINAD